MSQHPTSPPPSSERYRPRSSGRALAGVAEAFGLRELDDPTLARWLGGEASTEERTAAVAVLAARLAAAGARVAPGLELDEAEVLGDLVLHHAEAWDALRSDLERQALFVAAADGPWLVFAFLRLVAIDLAVRGAAAAALQRGPDEEAQWDPPDGFDALVERARAALERPERPADEQGELGDALEAGHLRLLEQAEQELTEPTAPSRAALLELVRRGTRASAARELVERLRRAEGDPLWAADLRAACGPWRERLRQQGRWLADGPEVEPSLRRIDARAEQQGLMAEERQALRAEALWVVQADLLRDAAAPDRWGRRDPSFVLPADEHPPQRARAIQAELLAAEDELDGTLEHGRRALALAPDDPTLLVGVGVMLAERAAERRHLGWEYHVDVALVLLRRATWIEPRWDRPWIEIGIVLAELGAWNRARRWVEGIPADVPVSPRLLRLRALLLGRISDARSGPA